jgi:glycine cleavage system T protein (aminomethyltransferase)
MGKRTPLCPTHLAAGARLVDFAGWDMPLHYGSQIEEHHAVRRSAGMFDVSHMLIVDLQRAGARAFLRLLVANNVDKLTLPGKALYTCMLRPDGGVIDDLIVYFFAEDDFRIVVNAGTADKDLAWIKGQADRYDAELSITPRRDLAMIAVQGPQARQLVWQAVPGTEEPTAALKPFSATRIGEMLIARTGYTGEDGFELMVPNKAATFVWNALAAAGVRPAGLGARDTLRLEAGMNLYGQDMDETVSPLESGLTWSVDLAAERDFIGKSALLAANPTRQLAGLLLLDRGVLRAHQKVFTDRGAGEITSGTFSPTLDRSIALARVPRRVAVGETVEVEVRDKMLKARVVKPPFVRSGRVLV